MKTEAEIRRQILCLVEEAFIEKDDLPKLKIVLAAIEALHWVLGSPADSGRTQQTGTPAEASRTPGA